MRLRSRRALTGAVLLCAIGTAIGPTIGTAIGRAAATAGVERGTASTPPPAVQVVAVQPLDDDEIPLVVALGSARAAEQGLPVVTATAAGTSLPTEVEPLLSDGTDVVLVLDGSSDGAPDLRAGGLSGAVDFLLQLPSTVRTAVVADRRPPVVASAGSVGAGDDLRVLSGWQGSGERATAEALTLALRELPSPQKAQPVIVLYTGAANAGTEAAGELGERLRRANTTLAVVTTSTERGYWTEAATRTGGLVVHSPDRQGIEAFDAVARALRARYVVRVARPAAGVTQVNLSVEAGGGPVTVEVTLPPDAVGPAGSQQAGSQQAGSQQAGIDDPDGRDPVAGGADSRRLWLWFLGSGALLLAGVAGAIRLRRNRNRAGVVPPQPSPVVVGPPEIAVPAAAPKTDPAPEPEPLETEPPETEPPETEPPETEAGYRVRLQVIEEQVEREPDSPDHRRRLATAHQSMADVDRDHGRMALADAGYRRALDALQQRVALDPANPAFRRDLAVALTRLAELDAAQGWPAQAAAGIRRVIEIDEWLVQADPDDPGHQRHLRATRALLAALEDQVDDVDGGAAR